MIDSIFILSGLGEVIIEKHYRHGTSRTLIADLFWEQATIKRNKGDEHNGQSETEEDIPPVVPVGPDMTRYAAHVKRGDLTFVAGLSRDTSPMMVVEFLHRVADVLTDYLGTPDEVKIKDAFSTVYQILDEMMDGGLPLVTEPNALKGMIAPPTVVNKVKAVVMGGTAGSALNPVLPVGAVSSVPWRDKTVSYIQNEIFLDVEEQLDCVLDAEDEPLNADVRGCIKVTTHLSGMPEILLSFENPSVLGDVSFHPCVRIDRWEREKVLSFVPPDGSFELMWYRTAAGRITPAMVVESVPFYCRPSVTIGSAAGSSSSSSPPPEAHIPGRMEILVGPRKVFRSPYAPSSLMAAATASGPVVDDVCVRLPLPSAAKFLTAKAGEGKVSFLDRTCVWHIGKIDMNKTALRLTGSFALPSTTGAVPQSQVLNCAAFLEFSLVAKPVSGLKVASLEITNQTYKYFKGIKSILKAGEFQIRT